MKKNLYPIIALFLFSLLPLSTSCDYIPPISTPLSTQFDIKVTNAWDNNSFLIAEVTIIPNSTYNGTTPIYLALFSKDGYYFGKAGAYTWTPQELKSPDSSIRNIIRDINIIKAMEKQKSRQIQLHVPISDKAAVSCIYELKAYDVKSGQDERQWLADNIEKALLNTIDLPDRFSEESKSMARGDIFKRHFTIKIVTKEEATKLDASK